LAKNEPTPNLAAPQRCHRSRCAKSTPYSVEGEVAVPAEHEIRADYDRDTIAIYQAYSPAIADAALKANTFVPPFSFHRMTWIKPSFLWLMHRSNWGQKCGQERVVCVRVNRSGWEKALSLAVLTSFVPGVDPGPDAWAERFAAAVVHLQWDPERSLRGTGLPYSSIQVGLSRHIIREYVEDWVVWIEDYMPRVRKMRDLLRSGKAEKARRFLPPERVYPVSLELGRRCLSSARDAATRRGSNRAVTPEGPP
jgi:hypothetical protein